MHSPIAFPRLPSCHNVTILKIQHLSRDHFIDFLFSFFINLFQHTHCYSIQLMTTKLKRILCKPATTLLLNILRARSASKFIHEVHFLFGCTMIIANDRFVVVCLVIPAFCHFFLNRRFHCSQHHSFLFLRNVM